MYFFVQMQASLQLVDRLCKWMMILYKSLNWHNFLLYIMIYYITNVYLIVFIKVSNWYGGQTNAG